MNLTLNRVRCAEKVLQDSGADWTILDGRNAHLSDGVQRALDREPRDFTDYAKTAAAAGVWNI